MKQIGLGRGKAHARSQALALQETDYRKLMVPYLYK